MVNKKHILIVVTLLFYCVKITRAISSINSFDRAISKSKFAVVMLYEKDRALKKANSNLYKDIIDALSMFKTVSSSRSYKKANVRFIRANVGEEKLESLPQEMGVAFNNLPAYFMYIDGKLVRSTAKNVVQAEGFLTADELRQFIDKYLQSSIEDYIDDKKQEEKERRVYVGGYPWYGYYPWYGGWGYPYWGYGYGPRIGFGFGLGW